MITIEQRAQQIVEANRGDKAALIHAVAREIDLLRAVMPSPADLEAIAYHLETACTQEIDLPDGTTLDASLVLRRAARLIREVINEEGEPPDEAARTAALA